MSELLSLMQKITNLDSEAMQEASQRQDILTKPQGSLGLLEQLSIRLAGIFSTYKVDLSKKAVFVWAGDHGVAAQGVSAFPQEVTQQMVLNFIRGGAAINVLAKHVGADVFVIDAGVKCPVEHPQVINLNVKRGTNDFTVGPAMSCREAETAILNGIKLASEKIKAGYSVIATGDMGIGNTTPSTAIIAALSGQPLEKLTGYGTGITSEAWAKKVAAIKKAFAVNKPDTNDPLDVLAKVGGLEIAGICGTVLGAALNKRPVIIDGLISAAGALIAGRLAPKAVLYMFASHASVEPSHQVALNEIGLAPMLHMDMRLGEGTGAVLAMPILEAAVKIINQMATFSEAGVSNKDQKSAEKTVK